MRHSLLLVVLAALAACSRQEPPKPVTHRPVSHVVAGRYESGGAVVNLPKEIGDWTRADAPRRITAGTIFDYMDGAGEMYLAYRFDHLDVFEYKPADASRGTILAELYWMKSPLDAFGLLSTDWTGEPAALGVEPGAGEKRVETVPPHHALFGAGLLRLWSGSLYARVLAARDTPETREAVMTIGRALAARPPALPPGFVASVPPTTAGWPGAKETATTASPIRPGRTCFFHSHLVLNSQYFLASQDILNLGPDAAAVTTEYAPSRPGALPLRLIVVRYPNAAGAAAGASSFRRAYAPSARAAENERGAVKTQHGWVAWRVEGPGLAIALDAEDQKVARALVDQAARVSSADGQQ